MSQHTGPSEVIGVVTDAMPEEIADVVAKRNAKVGQIAAIDAELARLDKLMEEYGASLAEMRDTHAAKGRERTELARSVARLERMAEAGCTAEGLPLPTGDPTPRDVSGDLLPIPANRIGEPAPLPKPATGSPAAKIDDALNSGPLAVLGDPTVTRADDPAGGDQPEEGRFHPGNGHAR